VNASTTQEWIVHLAYRVPPLAVRTIGLYKSAARTRWAETGHGPNPWDSEILARMLKGISNARADLAPSSGPRPPSLALTPDLIGRIAYLYPTTSPAHVMRFAAMTLATCALLRPGEVLGSGGVDNRPLLASSITFYALRDRSDVAHLLPQGADLDRYARPDRYSIYLGVTKADRTASNLPSVVAAPLAVDALWRWMHLRRDLGVVDPLLFYHAGVPLRVNTLTGSIKAALGKIGYRDPVVTGKTFRRGGASALVAAGVPLSVVAAAGRWRTIAMVSVYADAESKAARVLAASRGL
jgi:integrase